MRPTNAFSTGATLLLVLTLSAACLFTVAAGAVPPKAKLLSKTMSALLSPHSPLVHERRSLVAAATTATHLTSLGAPAALEASMAKQAATLVVGIVAARTAAENAATTAYVSSAVPGPSLGVFSSSSNIQRRQAQSIYTKIASSTLHNQILHDTAAASEINTKLVVLEDTLAALSASSVRALIRQVTLEQEVTSETSTVLAMDRRLKLPISSTVSSTPQGLLSIMGPSVLTPAQLAAWYRSRGYTNKLGTPVIQIAAMYIEEGAASGVRGDVAFAEAVLETGGFSSMSGRFNMAGIGDCDSCNGGYNFPSLRTGIKAQIELLEAYASPTTTKSKTARHAIYKWIDTDPARAKHPTWYSLGGSWSSDPAYGEHVLALYLEALTLARKTSTPPLASPLQSLSNTKTPLTQWHLRGPLG
jgi:hypothetical protein